MLTDYFQLFICGILCISYAHCSVIVTIITVSYYRLTVKKKKKKRRRKNDIQMASNADYLNSNLDRITCTSPDSGHIETPAEYMNYCFVGFSIVWFIRPF